MPPTRSLPRAVALLAAALLALTLLGAPTASARPSSAPASAPSAARDAATAYANQAFNATNAQRRSNGRAALRKNACLQRYAARQASRMAAQSRMFHQDLGPILSGCRLSAVGENVAYGFASGRDVVRGWMGSAGHRANILNGRYRLMAIAARQSRTGQWYTAQVFGAR